MRQIAEGLVAAFSIYSVLPVPARLVKWDRDSMRYTLCFLPAVGIALLLAELLWQLAALRLGASRMLYGAVAALLPVVLSGGIHLDGLIDTMDAIGSHAPPERKLEILHDPRTGAFGVMGCAGYLLLSAALWSQIYPSGRHMLLASAGFVFSRALVAFGAAGTPPARQAGMIYMLHASASVAAVRAGACVFFLLSGALAVLLDAVPGLVTVAACLILSVRHRRFCLREFGGNTGDLCGFLMLGAELVCQIIAAVGGMLA